MANARKTDPKTSHDAADSVKDITKTQEYVLKALKRPRNDTQLIEAYRSLKTAPRASESGIRSRRSELVGAGLVVDSGKRVKMPSGRFSIVLEKK
jgi:hypothetical protein